MTIEEIAKRLNECANKKACKTCKYSWKGMPTMHCEGDIVKEMADVFRKRYETKGDEK